MVEIISSFWGNYGASVVGLLWAAVSALLRPSTVIAGLGPYLINLSIKILRGNVSLDNINATVPEISELRRVLQDQWVAALRNWAIQIYTVILSVVTVLFELISTAIALLRHPDYSALLTVGSHELKYLAAVIVCLAGLIWSCHLVLSRAPRRQVVALYLPPSNRPHDADFAKPPWLSPLTWARAILIFTGWTIYATGRMLGVLT